MHALSPLTLQERYYISIEAEIQRIINKLIYEPLIEILSMRMKEIHKTEIQNAGNPLLDAISMGLVWYEDGEFKGKFNSKISIAIMRVGGKFNPKTRTYELPRDKLPPEISMAQAGADSRYKELKRRMTVALDNMDVQNIDSISKSTVNYEKTLAHMESDLQKTMPKELPKIVDNPPTALSRITVEAKLTEEQKRIIAESWGTNLNLYIKKWSQKNILDLREKIQPHVMAGGRAQGLVKVIQDNYGVGARKAKFLARQETALLMSKFQETRYKDIGIQKYRWSDSHDRKVRHDHHELNGKVFRFDSPPVSNRKTGARNNPGQDYNCRCVAIPLVD